MSGVITLKMLRDAHERIKNEGHKDPTIVLAPINYQRAELMVKKGFAKFFQGDMDVILHWCAFVDKYPEYEGHELDFTKDSK